MELVNIDPSVMKYVYKLYSKDSCASIMGQIALELLANPPKPGDPSYPLYQEVRELQFIFFFFNCLVFQNLRTARVYTLFPSFPRKRKESGTCWLRICGEHKRFLILCRVSPANQEEHSYSQECVFQLKRFRKPRLQFILN